MNAALKAEFRKLLTVRSTYVITILVLGLVALVAFYAQGWRLTFANLQDPNALANDITGDLPTTVFGAIVAILLVTHEYRYNTISYSLTASRSRTAVLLSKTIVISAYALALAAALAILAPLMAYLGIQLHHNTLAPQTMQLGDLAWRSLFFGWGYGMVGFLLAALTRNQVASIVALFTIPSLVEQLLALLLKHNTVYLPFSALSQVIQPGSSASSPQASTLSPGKAAIVFCLYVLIGWMVAWRLFLRRDAN
jgi:ABC-type transport system involved in multi-copper enzyme maturation permease subunit